MTDERSSEVRLQPVLKPATILILGATCTSNEADATVTFVVKVIRTDQESLEEVTATVGGTEATLTEQTGSPVESPAGIWTHTYDGEATVACDETHDIDAQATIMTTEEATTVPVTCGPCEEGGEGQGKGGCS